MKWYQIRNTVLLSIAICWVALLLRDDTVSEFLFGSGPLTPEEQKEIDINFAAGVKDRNVDIIRELLIHPLPSMEVIGESLKWIISQPKSPETIEIINALFHDDRACESEEAIITTAIQYAADDNAVLNFLIDRCPAQVHRLDKNGYNALIWLVKTHNKDTEHYIDELKLNVNFQVQRRGKSAGRALENNVTALHIAVADGSVEIVKMLLRKGAWIDTIDGNGASALNRIANKNILNSVEVAKILISHGANVDQQDRQGYSSLQYSAQHGNLPLAKLLFKHKAKPNIMDHDGCLSLNYAVVSKDLNLTKLFLENGSIIDHPADWPECIFGNPLGLASARGWDEGVELLLRSGANVNRQSSDGQTPLMYAAKHTSTIEILIRHHAHALTVDKKGDNVLHKAIAAKNKEVIPMLIQHGANPLLANKAHKSALNLIGTTFGGAFAKEMKELWKETEKMAFTEIAERG